MAETPPPPARRRLRKRYVAAAAGAVAIAGGLAFAIGPGAAWLVDHIGDGQHVWRLGRIKIDHVSGAWLGDLHAKRVRLIDSSGVWAEAEDVSLAWRPFDLFGGVFHLDAASASRIAIIRRPLLSPATPGGGGGMDTTLGAIHIARLELAQPVFGAAGVFRTDLALALIGGKLDNLDLNLQRLDSDADHAVARYHRGHDFALHVDVASAEDGVIAHMLGVADNAARLTADGTGDEQSGEARFDGQIGAVKLDTGAMQWTPADWRLNATLRLDALPALGALSNRIGEHIALDASGARHGRFSAHAVSDFLDLTLSGALDENAALDGPAHIVAATNRLSDIAHESPLELGAARLEGTLTQRGEVTAIDATLDGQDVALLGQRGRLAGPVHLELTPEAFRLHGDLTAPTQPAPLFANARLATDLDYNRNTGRFTLSRAALTGDALAASARGWANGGDGEFDGEWRVRKLDTLSRDLRGEVGGLWRAGATRIAANLHIWSLTLQGRGAKIAGAPALVPELLGDAPTLDATLRFDNGGVSVDHARVQGAQLRAAAMGRIVRGQANLRLEATARGPLQLGGASIAGAADATGRLTGNLARPTLDAEMTLASLSAGGVDIDHPQVKFTLAPDGRAYRGHATAHGAVRDLPATAEGDLGFDDSGFALHRLVAQVGALEGRGEARIAARGVDAQLALTGRLDGLAPDVSGAVVGAAALTPQMVTINARITDGQTGDLAIRTATLDASGPYRAIAAHINLRGRLRQAPFTFAGSALVSTEHDTSARFEGSGALAGVAVSTRTPLVLNWPARGGIDTTLDVAIGDGTLTGRWSETARTLSGAFTMARAPIAPIAAIWGERATGTMDGRFTVAKNGAGLAGDADLSLVDARFAGRQRGTLDAHIVGKLEPTRLQATMDAQSSDGLTARFEADAPVVTSAAPLRIALAPERRGEARWSLSGPVETLWAAARFDDQDLRGAVSGEGQLSFGEGYLAGDGRIALSDGAFEDKISGVKLQHIDAAIAIAGDGVHLEHFSAADSRGGTLTATGGSANAREGQISLELHELRLVDRPDAHARASGALNFQWQGLDSSLGGELNILDADISVAGRAEAGIPQLDVVEINRPESEDDDPPPAAVSNHPTHLDIRVRAPGRVFTRGRGLEAEWSLDMQLTGDSANPRIFGNAQAIRGTLSLSGQPFEIDTGRIDFNGALDDARINLTATRETADLTAHIQLTGTAADPDVTLTSDPALPEDEILPQVLFGRSVADLSGLEAAQLAASLAALSGQASFDLVDAARAAAGLDRFNVREDENGGLLVAGGVYLTRDVYLEVGRNGLGQASTRVEWTLRPKLVLITSFLQNGDQRVSVRWRREGN